MADIESVLQRLVGRSVDICALSPDRAVMDLANGILADVIALRRLLSLPNDMPIALARPEGRA